MSDHRRPVHLPASVTPARQNAQVTAGAPLFKPNYTVLRDTHLTLPEDMLSDSCTVKLTDLTVVVTM